MPARAGIVWVIASYRLFRANMPLLSALTFGYLMVFTLMLVLPGGIGGMLFPLLQPMLTLAIANGCRGIAKNGNRPPPPDLLAGIRKRRPELMKLGALQLAGSLTVMLMMYLLDAKPDPEQPDQIFQVMAVVALLSSPLLLAFWFSPLLTGWHDVPPLKSTFFSLVAALRNWRAFLVYALTLLAVVLLPALLAMFAMQISETFGQILAKAIEILMLLLVLPTVLAGTYVSYHDIFAAPPVNEP